MPLTVERRGNNEPANAAATAAVDQLAARIAHETDCDSTIVAKVAPALLREGARAQLDAVVVMLESDDGCRGYADSLSGERRIGAHMAVGAMVSKLKIFRRMTEGN